MLTPELRDQVQAYLEERITFEALIEWLVPREYELLSDATGPDANLIAAVELNAAEMADGLLQEYEVRDSLLEELHAAMCNAVPRPQETFSSNKTIRLSSEDFYVSDSHAVRPTSTSVDCPIQYA